MEEKREGAKLKSPGRPPRENTKRRTIIFDNDLWDSLKIIAMIDDTNVTNLIHKAVREYIKKRGLPKEEEVVKAVLKQMRGLKL